MQPTGSFGFAQMLAGGRGTHLLYAALDRLPSQEAGGEFQLTWLPVVGVRALFCLNPSPEGSALLSRITNLTFLGLIAQNSGQGNSVRVSR